MIDRRRLLVMPALLGSLALAVAALAAGGGASSGRRSEHTSIESNTWRVGEAVPIRVHGGRAQFTVATTDARQRTLVIVSSLACDERERTVRLAARATPGGETPERIPMREERPKAKFTIPPAPAGRPCGTARAPVGERTFHLLVRQGDPASARNYLPVRGVLRAVGRRVAVYADARDHIDAAVVDDLVHTFDERVEPMAARRWGPARDVDGDGRFVILLTGWLSRFGGGSHAVDGFVRGADFDSRLPAPFSNHCDMLYLSAELEPGPHLRTVLAHEYAHAVTFSRKMDHAQGALTAAEEEGWLDEAIAHLVEDLHGFSRSNIDYRVAAFLASPEQYRLVVDDYYAADLFRSHGNRGSTYLFLRWCIDRYGESLLDELVLSPRGGIDSLEAATGRSFAELYRAWSIDLARSVIGFPAAGLSLKIAAAAGGPRTHAVASDGVVHSWSMDGTTSHYAVVDGSAQGGVQVEVEGPPDAELQVTALPMPADLALPDLAVRPVPGPGGMRCVRMRLRERDGQAVTLEEVAWMPLAPAGRADTGGTLAGERLARALGTTAIPGGSQLVSEPIALPGLGAKEGPALVTVLGRDSRGRRVVVRAEVGAETKSGDDSSSGLAEMHARSGEGGDPGQ